MDFRLILSAMAVVVGSSTVALAQTGGVGGVHSNTGSSHKSVSVVR